MNGIVKVNEIIFYILTNKPSLILSVINELLKCIAHLMSSNFLCHDYRIIDQRLQKNQLNQSLSNWVEIHIYDNECQLSNMRWFKTHDCPESYCREFFGVFSLLKTWCSLNDAYTLLFELMIFSIIFTKIILYLGLHVNKHIFIQITKTHLNTKSMFRVEKRNVSIHLRFLNILFYESD